MSELSDVCSLEEEPDHADSERTLHSASSLSRCNSSSSIVNSAKQTEKNTEASTSLETAWTDSKHSSYLDLMEANFVKNMYGRSYCVEDVCGKKSDHDHIHDNQDTDVEEYDDDSAQSGLRMSFETMEFKMYDHGDWTWRPVSRSVVPAGVPWVLLKNPWVKHFRPRNSSALTIPSTSSSSAKDTVGSVPNESSTISLTTIPSTLLSSRKDAAVRVDVLSRVTLSPKTVGHVEHYQRVYTGHEIASSSNPVDAGITNTKKRTLRSTYKQVPITRQKTGNEVKGGSGNGTYNQDDAAPSNVILGSMSGRLGDELVEDS